MAQYKLINYLDFDPACLKFSDLQKSEGGYYAYINYNDERKQVLIQSPKVTLDQGGIPHESSKYDRYNFQQFFDVNKTKHLNDETDDDREERSKVLKEFEKKLINIDENIKEVSNLKEVLKQLPDKLLKKLEHKPIVRIVEEDEDDSDDEKMIRYNSMKPKIKQKRINRDEEKLKLDIELYEKDEENNTKRIDTDDYSLDDLKKHIGYARKFKYCLHFSKLFISKSLNFWQIQLKLFRIQTYPRDNNLVMNLEDKTSKLFLDSDDEEEEENVKEFIKSENNFLDEESEESEESESEEEVKPKKKTRGKVKS